MAMFEFQVRGMSGRINLSTLVDNHAPLARYRAILEERFRAEQSAGGVEGQAAAARRAQIEVEALASGFLRDLSGDFLLRKMHAIDRVTEIQVLMRELVIEAGETGNFSALQRRAEVLVREQETLITELRQTTPSSAGPEALAAVQLHRQRLDSSAGAAAAERALLADIEALRTPTGAVDPAARARLLARLPPTMKAGDDAEVRDLAASLLGYRPDAIKVKLVGPEPGQVGQFGVSGAKVYLIRATEGGQEVTVAAVKVFPKTEEHIQEFARELSALDRLGRENLSNQGAVRRLGAGRTPEGAGVLIMSGAAGRSIDSLLVALGKREASLDEVRQAVQRNGEALARLHTATTTAAPASPAVTKVFVDDFNVSLQQLEALAAKNPRLARVIDLAAVRRQANELIAGIEKNPGTGTVVHGDYHPGNVFYDAAQGRITMIDVARTHTSIDTAGTGIASAGRDAATFVSALMIFGQQYNVPRGQLAELQASFLQSYSSAVARPAFSAEALAFHRARYALRQLYASMTEEANAGRFIGSLAEFKKDFGLR
jgi:hypothetical protein